MNKEGNKQTQNRRDRKWDKKKKKRTINNRFRKNVTQDTEVNDMQFHVVLSNEKSQF